MSRKVKKKSPDKVVHDTYWQKKERENYKGKKEGWKMEEKKRDRKRSSLYCYNQQQTHQSILSLTHTPASSTGLRAMACLGFLSISCSTAPWGGSWLCQQENGLCLQGNEEDSPRGAESQEFLHTETRCWQTQLCVCIHKLTLRKSSQYPTSHLLPRFHRVHMHTLSAFA